MTGFLHNLIATAKQQRPVLRPRPISLFETAPRDNSAGENFSMPPQPHRITGNADMPTPHRATETQTHISNPPADKTIPAQHRLAETFQQPAMQQPQQSVTKHTTITKVIREIQTVAPAPVIPAPINSMDTPTEKAALPTKNPQPETTKDPASHPGIPTPAAPHPHTPTPHNAVAPMTQPERTESVTAQQAHIEERHRHTEHVVVEKALQPRATAAEQKPPSIVANGKPSSSTPHRPATRQRQQPPPAERLIKTPAATPVVTVSIGTVEIQAVSTPRQPVPRPRTNTPQPLSLNDYLQQRNRGSFE